MNGSFDDKYDMIGQPPGTLTPIGVKVAKETRIHYVVYDKETKIEKKDSTVQECKKIIESGKNVWIKVIGLSNIDAMHEIGSVFDIHALVLEDVINSNQRPKYEEYDTYLFFIAKLLSYDKAASTVDSSHVSLIMGENYLITFLEDNLPEFFILDQRMDNKNGKIRLKTIDFLSYSILDIIVDCHILLLNDISEDLEELEEKLVQSPGNEDIQIIQKLKRNLIHVRKSIWPLREIVGKLEKEDVKYVSGQNSHYYRDLYEHAVQALETIDNYRDMLSGFLDIYLSSVSNRMNETMKVLTIISTIFIPLSFIAGLYGMNFANMPELGWDHGYHYSLALMAAIVCVMVIFFRNRQWL